MLIELFQLETSYRYHSIYIVVENTKRIYNFVKTELCNSALSETVISEIDYPNSIEKNKEEVEIVSSAESDITMALQSLVNLSDQIFEVNNNPSFIDEEMNM
ncbi:4503_t:CDS:2, partial [Cetraspora pellucida]